MSAWGIVEFEDRNGQRTPIAITGASRDLSDLKQHEQINNLLLRELTHRVKNTLATIQGVASQTLRNAGDLTEARDTLNSRIRAMAQAHDLLTADAWKGADLADLVERVLSPFARAQIDITGPSLGLSARHTLALSLALHELATNATKYGALSTGDGRLRVHWELQGRELHLDWEESGGPEVKAPSRKGFGSRLIEELVVNDLSRKAEVLYEPTGARCNLVVSLDLPDW